MITLRLLLGLLCAVGHDATSTTVTAPPTGTQETPIVTTAAATPQAPPTSAATTSIKPTTAADTATTIKTTTADIANTVSKTTKPGLSSTASTVPTTIKPITGTSLTQPTTSQAVIVNITAQQSQQLSTKTPIPGPVSTTHQSTLSSKVVTSNVTDPDNSTTPKKDATGLIKTSTVATSQPHSAATGIPSTASPTAPVTSQQSNVTDATNSTNSTNINAPTLKLTVSPHPAMMFSTTTSKSTADVTTYSLTTPVTSSRTMSPVFNAEHTYKDTIVVTCQNYFSGSPVKINMKFSRICTNNSEKVAKDKEDEENTFMHLCKAVKPGYQPNKDNCKIVLGFHSHDQVAIVDAFVENRLDPEDLYEQLKGIKNQENKSLFLYDSLNNKDEDNVSIPLISAIVCLAVLLLIIAAIYGCWHQRKTWKREQRLTEELQTMENGYHDNPTLEVMETSPEMQEKKGGPNGELGDSWIVPLDNLTREDLDEEDTHL
ncbi:podocalyxin [Mixophyes fleayi]|uniref:podocalyxin n=1 Tax=Mixophyes fleayi TaxID=3061075 RepID=UPI003F4DC66A